MNEIIIGLIGAFIGYIVKYILDKKKDFASENAKILRENYMGFVQLIFGILFDKESDRQGDEFQKKIQEFIKDFYPKAVLYSSPEVLNAFADFMQSSFKDNRVSKQQIFYEIGKIIKEMRKELELTNTKLDKDGVRIFRAFLKDYDSFFNDSETKKS